jgi:excisionase family DNA binding protein
VASIKLGACCAAMATVRPEVTGRKPRSRSRRLEADRLVYTVPEAGRLLGLGRNAAYEAARRGDIPTLRMGRLLLVPKIPFHSMLGITTAVAAALAKLIEPEAPEAGEK